MGEQGGESHQVMARLWSVSLIPRHAAADPEHQTKSSFVLNPQLSTIADGAVHARIRCGRWSCEKGRSVRMSAVSLPLLRASFGDAPHSEHLPRPFEYGAHSSGYRGLARASMRRWQPSVRPNNSSLRSKRSRVLALLSSAQWRWRRRRTKSDPNATSCMMAYHLIPLRYHPTSCASRIANGGV